MKDLKLLIKDYAPIAKNAFTILINISSDTEVLKDLAKDDAFLETLLSRITVCQFPIAVLRKIPASDVCGRTQKSQMRMKSQCSSPTWPRTTPYKESWS